MSRYNLRDVSERLTRSRNIESVIAELLRTLELVRSDWRPSLAFYEVSKDALVDVYELDDQRLVRRNIVVPVDRLPHRLVRRIFQTTAPVSENERTSVYSTKDPSSVYEADERDASQLVPLAVLPDWTSCICIPLTYQDDLIAMLVITSARRATFAGKAMGEIVPIKSVATVALAQHLYRFRPPRPQAVPEPSPPPAATLPAREPVAAPAVEEAEPTPETAALQREVDQLSADSARLDEENRSRAAQIDGLMRQIEQLDRNSTTYKDELERVKAALGSMEQDAEVATEYLAEAFQQLQATQWTLDEIESTVAVLQEVFQLLASSHDVATLPDAIVEWFTQRFGIERCSLMVPDARRETLIVLAQRGIDPGVAAQVRVRIGQGVAGWVAAHGKPLYVRVREDAQSLARSPDPTYNSDSFIVVPLRHNGRLHAVLSLSNRLDGEGFSQVDLDRAMLAASAFAVTFGNHQTAQRAAAWA